MRQNIPLVFWGALLSSMTTNAANRNVVAPFFDRQQESVATIVDAHGHILQERVRNLKAQEFRRRLSTGSHPNLPGGGDFTGGGGGGYGADVDFEGGGNVVGVPEDLAPGEGPLGVKKSKKSSKKTKSSKGQGSGSGYGDYPPVTTDYEFVLVSTARALDRRFKGLHLPFGHYAHSHNVHMLSLFFAGPR